MKKSRQGRRNDKQLSFLVDYMVQNPHVASGKFHTLNGKSNLAGSWEELVSNLNDLRNPGVKEKNIKSWKEVIIKMHFIISKLLYNPVVSFRLYLVYLFMQYMSIGTYYTKLNFLIRITLA